MINVTPALEQAWHEFGKLTATPQDIALIEARLNAKLPLAYADFVQHYGFVVFGYDKDRTCMFDYAYDKVGQREVRRNEASFLYPTEDALKVYRNMTDDSNVADETLPSIPRGFFTFCSDPGQGKLLIELATGKIWYWPESDSRWGTEDNTALGFVADDFEAFINGLMPDPL